MMDRGNKNLTVSLKIHKDWVVFWRHLWISKGFFMSASVLEKALAAQLKKVQVSVRLTLQ
jgi:hypothetical protein